MIADKCPNIPKALEKDLHRIQDMLGNVRAKIR